MKHIKLISKFGNKLSVTNRYNRVLSIQKEQENQEEIIDNQEDIFYSKKSYNKIKQNILKKYKQNKVLKFKTHTPNVQNKAIHQPNLFTSKFILGNNDNHAIDFGKTLTQTMPRIPKIIPKLNFILSHDFKIEHPNFVTMKKMSSRKNNWINKSYLQSFPNRKNQSNSCNNTESSKEINKTSSSFRMPKVMTFHKELPRQIFHTPNIDAVTSRITGIVDFELSNKKTKTRVDCNSLRYQFYEFKSTPEFVDYSIDCISKHKSSADFTNSVERSNNKLSLPLFMCKIFSRNGQSHINDKSLELNNFNNVPLSYLKNTSFTSSNRNYNRLSKRTNTQSSKYCFKHLKTDRYRKYHDYISKQKKFYLMEL